VVLTSRLLDGLMLNVCVVPKVRSGFQVQLRRWVVERTFAWLMRYRRLVRDYEQRLDVSEAMLYISLDSSLLHRIRFR
jgi:putative transposase